MPSEYSNRQSQPNEHDYEANPITLKYLRTMPRVKGSKGWAINEIRHRLKYMKECLDAGHVRADRRNVAMGTIFHLMTQIDKCKSDNVSHKGFLILCPVKPATKP